jgi:hypothetical protein
MVDKLGEYVDALNERHTGVRIWHVASGPYVFHQKGTVGGWLRARLESNDGRRRRLLWSFQRWCLVDARRGEV